MLRLLVLASIVVAMAASPAMADGVKIGVNIGIPSPPIVVVPPPVVIASPPQLVVVPGTPVFYAPGASINVFAYGGHYYSFHEGAWFVAAAPGRPWVAVAPAKVPRHVLAVPVTYYKIPPGHAKKLGRDGGRGRGCPPGLAKQGRC
jgi:hypothetical protein